MLADAKDNLFLSILSAAGAPMLLMLYQSSIGLFALQYIIGRIGLHAI